VVHLHSQRAGRLRWDDRLVAFVPDGAVQDQQVVGAAAGAVTLDEGLQSGAIAGAEAAGRAGFPTEPLNVTGAAPLTEPGDVRQLWLVPGRDGSPAEWDEHFVDLQRDQTVADVWRATAAGMRSVEHVKRYTSIGTATTRARPPA
jgi:sarcosine oxidase subunit alpha